MDSRCIHKRDDCAYKFIFHKPNGDYIQKNKTETYNLKKQETKRKVWNITKQKQQTELQRKGTNGGTELAENKR